VMAIYKILPELIFICSFVLSLLYPTSNWIRSFGFELIISIFGFVITIFVLRFFQERYTSALEERYHFLLLFSICLISLGLFIFLRIGNVSGIDFLFLWFYAVLIGTSYALFPIRLQYYHQDRFQLYFIVTCLFLVLGITEFSRGDIFFQNTVRLSYYAIIEVLTWKK
jgi:hypothetical protein